METTDELTRGTPAYETAFGVDADTALAQIFIQLALVDVDAGLTVAGGH